MKKWEYKLVGISAEVMATIGSHKELSALGKEGWELAAIVNVSECGGEGFVYYLKRELPEQQLGIVVTKFEKDYHAGIKGYPTKWETRESPEAAVGALMITRQQEFGIIIELPMEQ